MRIGMKTALLVLGVVAVCAGADEPGAEEKKPERMVYLVDASGSMMKHWRSVTTEVGKSLDGVGEGQTFAVLLDRELPAVNPKAQLPQERPRGSSIFDEE